MCYKTNLEKQKVKKKICFKNSNKNLSVIKMSSLRISIILFTVLVITLNSFEYVSCYERNYPGAIELIGFNNNRRSRMRQDFLNNNFSSGIAAPMKKVKADIETVKQNIDEYNKLFKVDTKKLTEQQKDMLERIVERVARLKETFDIDDIDNSSNINDFNDGYTTDEPEPSTTSFPTTTLISDTSAEYLQDNMEQISAETEARASHVNIDAETTSSDSASTISINSGTTSTLNNRINIPTKSKNRINTTKRPLSSSRTTTKRTSGGHSHRPTASVPSSVSSSPSSLSSAATLGSSYGTSSGQKVAAITTIQPQIKQQLQKQQQQLLKQQQQLQMQLQQQQQQQLQLQQQQHQSNIGGIDISIKQQQQQSQSQQQQILQDQDPIEQKTLPSDDHHGILPPRSPVGVAGGAPSADLLYNSNVTTSSIIDSLNTNAREDYYNSGGVVITDTASNSNNNNNNKDKKPSGTAKPTKYHYYPHNQHIYLLPECAIQQVCNAVYVRLNYTQPLCACPSRYRDPCSASLNEDDQHTTKLIGDGKKKAITLAKTCEAVTEMRDCRTPKDWSLLALQNTRTGKSHYLVICRCPDHFKLEGPMAHDQPTYASVPGIRVFGMMCVKPGVTIRKPSAQPPKRYQLQKPYYVPSNNRYPSNADTRQPSLSIYHQQQQQQQLQHQQQLQQQYQHHQQQKQDNNYQSQYQSNYQYLSRPTSSSILNNPHTEYPESAVQLSTFSGVYGRNNERKGENNVEAVEEGSGDSTNNNENNSSSSIISNNSNNNNNNSSINENNISSNNNNKNNDDTINDSISDDETITATTITTTAKREKRSAIVDDYSDIPEFPWHRIEEFQKTIVWD